MWKLGFAIFSLAAAPVFAQLPSNTLTITATRTINLQPDQALFSLSVTSSAATNLGQVVAALSGGAFADLRSRGDHLAGFELHTARRLADLDDAAVRFDVIAREDRG